MASAHSPIYPRSPALPHLHMRALHSPQRLATPKKLPSINKINVKELILIPPKPATGFDSLPPMVLKNIFRFIQPEDRILQVCKHWNAVAVHVFDPSTKNNRAIRWACARSDDHYAIMIACEQGHIEIVRELLKDKRCDLAANDNHVLCWACEKGHVEIVADLLKNKRVDPSANSNYALSCACRAGYAAIVSELIKHPLVDPSANSDHAFQKAAELGHSEVVKVLLQCPKVNPAVVDNICIRSSAENGHVAVVRELLKVQLSSVIPYTVQDPRVDPSALRNYAIKQAAYYGRTEVIKELLKDPRVDPSILNDISEAYQVDCYNGYPLRVAKENGHEEVVKLLAKRHGSCAIS